MAEMVNGASGQKPGNLVDFLNSLENAGNSEDQTQVEPGASEATTTAQAEGQSTEAQQQQQPQDQTQQGTEQQAQQQPDYAAQVAQLQKDMGEVKELLAFLGQVLMSRQGQVQQGQQAQTTTAPAQPPAPQEPEELAPDKWNELYLEDPRKATQLLIEYTFQRLMQQEQERQKREAEEQQRRQQELQQKFAVAYAGLIREHGREVVDKLGPAIEEVMTKEFPALLTIEPEHGLRIAFAIARQKAEAADPLSALAKPEVRAKVKEALRDEIVREYVQQVQAGNRAPVTIAGQPGGAQVVSPPEQPKTLAEAKRAFLAAKGVISR